jgi:hypothetical protein
MCYHVTNKTKKKHFRNNEALHILIAILFFLEKKIILCRDCQMHNFVQNILKMEISLWDIELSGLTGKIWIDAMFVTWMRCKDSLSA